MKVFAYTEVDTYGNVSIIDEKECGGGGGGLLMGFCQGGRDVSRAFCCVHAGLQGMLTDRSGSSKYELFCCYCYYYFTIFLFSES